MVLTQVIAESIATKQRFLADREKMDELLAICSACVGIYRQEGKLLFCGNGGSAGDAQHLAAELSGRFYLNRAALFAEALHVNTSFLTAVANDFGYEETYARAVSAMGKKGDALFCISTSGNSPNILRAAASAAEQGMLVIGMTGESGGALLELCDFCLRVPSTDTPRIQECHILLGHIICQYIEEQLFASNQP